MKKNGGFTLVELLIFIVLVGIVIGIFITLNFSLRYIHKVDPQTAAINLAVQRMELILEQKKLLGFDSFQDPCQVNPSLNSCAVPTGYVVNATIDLNWQGDTNYKVITVQITGDGDAILKTLVAKYD